MVIKNLSKSAVISADGKYRYELSRQMPFPPAKAKELVFVMLNPSTADHSQDDPTVRRCLGFMAREGFNVLTIVNLFAFRTAFPADLLKQPLEEIIGPDNDMHIVNAASRAHAIACAWGANASYRDIKTRAQEVLGLIRAECPRPFLCLGKTNDGHPLHPLFVPAVQKLVEWEGYRCS